MIDDGANRTTGVVSLERTKDINGQSTNEGIVVNILNGLTSNNGFTNTSHLLYSYNTSYVVPTEDVANYILSNGHVVANNNLTIGFLIPVISSSFGYPSRMLGIVQSSSLASGISHTLNLFGTQSVYYVSTATSINTTVTRNRRDTAATYRWIMRYE